MILVGYKKCGTCKKLEKLLNEKKEDYKFRDVKDDCPSFEELKKWKEKSGMDINKFLNTSGNIYKEMNLKDKKKDMSEEQILDLLSKEGMLIKRPVLIDGDSVFVGKDAISYIENSK